MFGFGDSIDLQGDRIEFKRHGLRGRAKSFSWINFHFVSFIVFYFIFLFQSRQEYEKSVINLYFPQTSQAKGDKFDFIQVSFYAIAWAARGRFYWKFTYTFSIQELFYWSAQMLLNKFSFFIENVTGTFSVPPFLGRVACTSHFSEILPFFHPANCHIGYVTFLHYSPCQGFLSRSLEKYEKCWNISAILGTK